MRAPKFNFIPERQLGEEQVGGGIWVVTIMVSKGLYFPKEMVDILGMSGKYFRLFADLEKKSVGWMEVKGKTELNELNDGRLATPNPKSGAVVFGIGKILAKLGYEKAMKMKLQVQTYTSPLVSGEISYVILPDIEKPYQKEEITDNN